MHPVLFRFGSISVYSYGVMIAMAFFVGAYLARRAARETDIPPDSVTDLALLLLISGIIGGRLLYVLLNIREYIENPVEIVMLQHGGLVFYGGAIGGIAALIIYARKRGFPIYKIGDLMVPYVALGQGIGRIGCFLNGCCWGKPTDSFFGVVFPGSGQPVHPTQIYSSLGLIFIYGLLRLLQKMKVKEGLVSISYGLFYSMFRFLMEFLRGDNMIELFGLTFSQFVSAIIFIVCIVLFLTRMKLKDAKAAH